MDFHSVHREKNLRKETEDRTLAKSTSDPSTSAQIVRDCYDENKQAHRRHANPKFICS